MNLYSHAKKSRKGTLSQLKADPALLDRKYKFLTIFAIKSLLFMKLRGMLEKSMEIEKRPPTWDTRVRYVNTIL